MQNPPPIGLLSDDDWHAAIQRIDHESALIPKRMPKQPEAPTRTEPRLARRVKCLMRTQPTDEADTPHTFQVGTRNLSSMGVGLLHGVPLDEGDHLILALEADEGFGAIVPATVCWCRRIGMVGYDGAVVYEIGVKFDRPVDLDRHLEAA
ncbi:MAG: PilZ domain-containing protein [Planctomycetota bacterium]